MPSKIQAELANRFPEFCERLLSLKGEAATLASIQALAAEYGITVSHEGARTFKKGPFSRYLERINSGRETREALCAAAGAGRHTLDAIEEAMVIELQDHLTSAEGGQIDIKFIVDQLIKLRTSISMRENSQRQQRDLERKIAETEAKLTLAEQREQLYKQQVAKLEDDAKERATREERTKAALAKAEKKGGVTADTRKLIEDVMAGRAAA